MEMLPASAFGAPTELPIPDIPLPMQGFEFEFQREPAVPEGEFIPDEFIP
jgi:hypothetical protein